MGMPISELTYFSLRIALATPQIPEAIRDLVCEPPVREGPKYSYALTIWGRWGELYGRDCYLFVPSVPLSTGHIPGPRAQLILGRPERTLSMRDYQPHPLGSDVRVLRGGIVLSVDNRQHTRRRA